MKRDRFTGEQLERQLNFMPAAEPLKTVLRRSLVLKTKFAGFERFAD